MLVFLLVFRGHLRPAQSSLTRASAIIPEPEPRGTRSQKLLRMGHRAYGVLHPGADHTHRRHEGHRRSGLGHTDAAVLPSFEVVSTCSRRPGPAATPPVHCLRDDLGSPFISCQQLSLSRSLP